MIMEGPQLMRFAKKRAGKNGKPRYGAVHVDLRGSERPAGTFASETAADRPGSIARY